MRCKRCGHAMREIEGKRYSENHPYGGGYATECLQDESTWECDCGCTEGFEEDYVHEELSGDQWMTDLLCYLAVGNWAEAIEMLVVRL